MSQNIDLNDTAIAFRHKTIDELRKSIWLFKLLQFPLSVSLGPKLASLGLRLGMPIKPLIRKTIFEQFCGGETVVDSRGTIEKLQSGNVYSILDYSIEGIGDEETFDQVVEETLRNIEEASKNTSISFCVFKPSGIGSTELFEKASHNTLDSQDKERLAKVVARFEKIAGYAASKKVRLFVDAEESWTQDFVDEVTESLMRKHNTGEPIIYHTIQMYRTDRLQYLKELISKSKVEGWSIGVKLVRGAYLDKERERAEKKGYASPVFASKEQTDDSFDSASLLCFDNREHVNVCLGTHNQLSVEKLVDLMSNKNIDNSDKRIDFAQLLGMSDNLTFNLSAANYRASKYVPYGPIKDLIPYLGRRAEENSSVAGQSARELELLLKEIDRRRHKGK